MTTKAISSIVIVGGGSAGWITAMYLNKLYQHQQQNVSIIVIESPDISVIGVGEATVHSIRFLFAAMGIDEAELLRETNATLKTGILFENWMKEKSTELKHQYFHPFEQVQLGSGIDITSRWLASDQRRYQRYDQGTSLSAHLMALNHSPKTAHSLPYQGIVPYGYHIDAVLLGRFLRKKATEAGVIHVEATVNDVIVKNNKIQQVQTSEGVYSADLFIDCTGFKGLLINELSANNWRSFQSALPCNKAVAMQLAYDEQQPNPRSYTTATALEYGWAWQIDLVNRRGTGYVYDSRYLTPEQAEQRLIDLHGGTDKIKVLKKNHLSMKVGCRKAFWLGNCVAIGLSGGFIEPLESTGLHVINVGVRLLATHLQSAEPIQEICDNYNRLLNGVYDDLKQFIVLHYCLSDRDDTEFWQYARDSVKQCPNLQRLLSVWRNKVCEYFDLAGSFSTTFTDENYRYILYGMQYYPRFTTAPLAEESHQIFAKFNRKCLETVQSTETHADFLAKLHQLSLAEITQLWGYKSPQHS
jgi:tryptophan halogenase